ncbi:chemotaxis protein CheB [Oscillatoria sp. CS-180]|uniref:chemotaxis protein CheB n=1 Tax=Oscillatoria sp. CS-180 TaxID=3021720 RepID=UPI0023305155|nr:chemotaxis protein CheB [Oscillatoria sp. CS-180]MDB9524923.1 chemotaxis protein CheB [Oscillatoria sp. CS-180]
MSNSNSSDNFFVVGIGASAGGVQVLETFFKHIPNRPDASFVVVQHLSPDFKSMMSEILQRHTSMTVHQIDDGTPITPGTVYVLPPRKNAVISNRKLHLLDRPGNLNYPIDLFFESLAREFAEHAIGIVLTGGGSDGTEGLQSISRAGGVALVQSPETAQFGSMPVNAISSGFVDKILSPKELAEAVCDIVQFVSDQKAEQGEDEAFVTQSQLRQIIEVLSEHEDVDFSDYKANTLRRRIRHRCALSRSSSVDDYLRLLQGYSEERKLLRQSLLIGATSFFRDDHPWQILSTEVLPQLLTDMVDGQQLRIWVSACATGEEAYSLAMIVDEAIVRTNKNIQVKLFATDIDNQALAIAAKGRYSETITNNISPERLEHYFVYQDGYFQVKQFLREMLIISPHDLTKNPGFSKMHLVTCRNVLIYMQPQLQEQVLRLLHFTLRPKGFLLLGSSENLGRFSDEFDSINAKWKLFQKRETGNRFLPSATPRSTLSIVQPSRQLQGKRLQNERIEKQFTALLAHCFEDELATCLLVNAENEIERVFYDSAKLLTFAPGEVRLQVTKFVPAVLKLPLETSMNRARRENKTVLYKDIYLRKNEQDYSINLKVGHYPDGPDGQLIIIVSMAVSTVRSHDEQTYQIDAEVTNQLLELQSELQQTRENLQVTIEELETTNEEQQATNEELLASNEELQSTNEELQSVNEELYTVNVEHQNKIRELTQLNEDIDNLLRSTDIGVVFIDRNLNIRKFTPNVSEIINVFPADIDRPLSHFTHSLADVDLREFTQQILISEEAAEQEVYNYRNSDTLLMRGNPYLRGDGARDGVVLSFVKINDITAIRAKLEETNSLLENIYTTSPIGFALLDENLHYLRVNRTLAEINKYPVDETIGKHITDVLDGEVGRLAQQLHEQVLETGAPIRNRLIEGVLHEGEQLRYWTASYFPVPLHNGQRGVAAAVTEITDLRKAEQAVEESQRFISRISESTPGIVYIYDVTTHRIIYLNNTVTALLGYTVDEVLQMDNLLDQLVHPDDVSTLQSYYIRLIAVDEMTETLELRIRKKDGKWRWLEMRNVVFSHTETGEIEQFLGISTDITQRKRAERELRKQKKALEDAISMAQAADSANQAKSEFLANMSHEIRTPMNLILGTSQLLSRTDLNPQQQDLLRVLRNNGKVLLTLIDDILDLSKLEAHELRIESHAFNLKHSLHSLAEPFVHQAEQKGVQFTTEIDDAVPQTVLGDEFRIQQVLRNLLSNAFKFTETGEIRIAVVIEQASEKATASEANPTKNALIFRVIDTGIGIEPEVQSKLFEPFIQADTSTTRQYGGTGLGLTISRRIVELMEGQIGVESVPGEGSTFWFKIPYAIPESETTPQPLETSENTSQPVSVQPNFLVVEDNQDNQHLLTLMLEELGYLNVEVVDDGQAFLDKLSADQADGKHYDIVLMDCQMPRLDGYEATRQFRQNEPEEQNLYIIGLTANAMQGDREKCLSAGMNDYLSKPIELEKLASILEKSLEEQKKI